MMEKILTDIWRPFNAGQEERWAELSTKLKETMTGLGISEVEKRQVVAAMGPAKGHWYSCPNGHVYNIGDCGGATVEANCPDCQERFKKTPAHHFHNDSHQDWRFRPPTAWFQPSRRPHGHIDTRELSVGTPGWAVSGMKCNINM